MSTTPSPDLDSSPSLLQHVTRAEETGGEYSHNARQTITFKHPGYSDEFEQNVLLRLFAFDREGGGLHFATALAACSLISGNTREGYFTAERGGARIELGDDDLLRGEIYYFYIGSEGPAKYPIYRSFQHWTFPHGQLPPSWAHVARSDTDTKTKHIVLAPPSASSLTPFVLRRDQSCRISLDMDYIESAHLCPRSQIAWFEHNGMARYNQNNNLSSYFVVDDIANCMALRSDIHKAFDDTKFVVVPKQGQWAVQFIDQTNNLGERYHNRTLSLDKGISINFLYSRFAWAVFQYLPKFFEAGVPREALVRVTEEGEFRQISKTVFPEEIQASTSRSRSSSPKKRKATEESQIGISTKRARYSSSDTPEPATPLDVSQYSISPAQVDSQELIVDSQELVVDKRAWIERGRPNNPELYCCDYKAMEAAAALGLPGKAEFDGGYLCNECKGVEYQDSLSDIDLS